MSQRSGGGLAPLLLVDCYIDDEYAEGNFLPHFPTTVPYEVVCTRRDQVPVNAAEFGAIVVSGSAASVLEPPPWIPPLADLMRSAMAVDVPVLGVCFGHQLLAWTVGGSGAVRVANAPEVGWHRVGVTGPNSLLEGMGDSFVTFVSHQDEVNPIPEIEVFAHTEQCAVHGLRVRGRRAWGVQFHAEMRDQEIEEIVRRRAVNHPELEIDPDAMLAEGRDSTSVASRMFENFFGVAGIRKC